MSSPIPLHGHPRLLASTNHLGHLRKNPQLPFLRQARQSVITKTRHFVRSRELTYNQKLHNALLNRAREMQCRVITLLAALVPDREKPSIGRRRSRMCEHRSLKRLRCCLQEGWNNADPQCAFDLMLRRKQYRSALAYDWLYHTLSGRGAGLLFNRQIALEAVIRALFLARTEEGHREWWLWLVMPIRLEHCLRRRRRHVGAWRCYDEVPEATEVLKRVGHKHSSVYGGPQ